MKLTELWRYPVKSMRGQRFPSLEIGQRGFQFDRHWMLIDADGRFVTQRQEARMSLIEARVDDGRLSVSTDGVEWFGTGDDAGVDVDVRIWGDHCRARLADRPLSERLSDFLGRDVRLVYLPTDRRRAVSPDHAQPGDQVGFADGFPFLLISRASLDSLNRRLAEPLPMVRFRPNIVVDGCAPHAEDDWKLIRIGAIRFRVVKPCSRCIIPSIDPATAERGPEPLKTLMTYRKRENKIFFGQNLVHEGLGTLTEGMDVEVLEYR